ncbi:predicted protein [Postia placenta Mad-698-R]|nr:predicted protein [Postia placenta Mad-698-R]
MSTKPKPTATRSSTRIKTNPAPTATRPGSRTAVASRAVTTEASAAAPLKKQVPRRPLHNRANSPVEIDTGIDKKARPASRNTKVPGPKSATPIDFAHDDDREPVKAFLRIRPRLGDGEPTSEPYLEPISDTAVRMTDPESSSHSRTSSANSASIYTFSHIFPPHTQQSEFFNNTTLPLVKDVLEGQSGLLFTYGVTNSGKTYTIQGGSEEGSAGILPRTLDVIFNSIEGLHGDGKYHPVRLNGIELADDSSRSGRSQVSKPHGVPALADILDDLDDAGMDIDSTTLKLDRNHEYTVWLSYSEVYNEKVYDLFASVDSPESSSQPSQSAVPRPTSTFLNIPLPSSQSHPLLLTRKALPVKSSPLSDSGLSGSEAGSAGKYVAGLRQIRVKSAAEAKALLKLGQMHRRVFGTLANSQSSRSHALVTIKVLRVHRGERNDPSSIQTSRLTLVDLAGSERTKHTHTSGDRLREAGNINKSLMVLGQCMETLRTNQRTLARSLGTTAGRMDTRDVKKGLAVVPFRHSKLTEILMDYFVGEGKAVMIVNVNPYDTGFDENSHVMRFSSLARDVYTAPAAAAPRALPSVKDRNRPSGVGPHRRKVTISMGGAGRKASEAHLEVLEEDEEHDDDGHEEDDDGPINPLVDALFDEIERLRTQASHTLYEVEMRCALVEAETREEVMEEMEERMHDMEKMFKRRLMKEVEQNERMMDAKIDMVNRSKLRHPLVDHSDEGGETDEHMQDEFEGQEELEEDPNESDDAQTYKSSESSRSPSPLAGKGQKKAKRGTTRATNRVVHSDYADDDTFDQRSDGDDWQMDTAPSQSDSREELPKQPIRTSRASGKKHDFVEAPSPIFEVDVKAGKMAAKRKSGREPSDKLSSLQETLESLTLQENARDSTVVVPNKKARQDAVTHGGEGQQNVSQKGEVDTIKKKKRQLGRAPTDEDMATILLGTSQDKKPLRRSVRH